MKLTALTNRDLIILNAAYSSKDELLKQVSIHLKKMDIVSDSEVFHKALLAREMEGPTGFEQGIAIPHGKSMTVKEPKIVIIKMEKPITDWESLQANDKIDLVFLLAIPDGEKGTTHLKLLSKLSAALMNQDFVSKMKAATTKDEVLMALETYEKEEGTEAVQSKKGKKILAVTGCAAGIAHTYMAAEALEKAGKELGIQVSVEKQGANGIEDRPTTEAIKEADALIVAVDVTPQQMEKYNGLPFVKVKVAEPIRNAKAIIQKALDHPDGLFIADGSKESGNHQVSEKKKEKLTTTLFQSVMTGISYMIPVIVGAGLMAAISQVGSLFFGMEAGQIKDAAYATDPRWIVATLNQLSVFSGFIFTLMFPTLSAFISYSIAGRVGIAGGIIGGGLCGGIQYSINGIQHGASGFLGAIVIGWTAGFAAKWLNEHIKLSKNLQSLKPMLFIPLITILLVYFVNLYIMEPVSIGLTDGLTHLLSKSGTNNYLVAVVISAARAIDLGGPFNKAGLAVSLALAEDKVFPMTADLYGGIVAPLGMGVSVLLNNWFFKKNVYSKELQSAGYTSLVSGIIGISEGALPFMLERPLIAIPINMIGSAIAAIIGTFFNVTMWFPIPQFWGWPLIEGLPGYLFGLVVGVLFVAIANIYVRDYFNKRKMKALG